jgi:hypothetical protein
MYPGGLMKYFPVGKDEEFSFYPAGIENSLRVIERASRVFLIKRNQVIVNRFQAMQGKYISNERDGKADPNRLEN